MLLRDAGTLEEQILQRHLCKAALASSVTGDAQETVPTSFSKRELQTLCQLTLHTQCATAAAYDSASSIWQVSAACILAGSPQTSIAPAPLLREQCVGPQEAAGADVSAYHMSQLSQAQIKGFRLSRTAQTPDQSLGPEPVAVTGHPGDL